MSANTLMSVEDYLRLIDKPYREYRDGVATAKAWPALPHSLTQGALLMWLGAQGVQPWPELTVRISPTKYLVPDVCVASNFPGPYPTEPVTLCCEILSPEDRLGSMFSKCEEYHAWGVPYCWVIDPVKCTPGNATPTPNPCASPTPSTPANSQSASKTCSPNCPPNPDRAVRVRQF